MDRQAYKEVYFDKYCKTCKHEKLEESEDPCAECMSEALNLNSHRPVRYDEKKKEPKR